VNGDEGYVLIKVGDWIHATSQPILIINQTQTLPEVQFTESSYTVNENAGNCILTLSLSKTSSSAVSCLVKTSDGTAHAGEDYEAENITATIQPGQTTATVSIPIYKVITSGTNTFNVTLSNPVGATLYGNTTAVVSIVSDIENNPMGDTVTGVSGLLAGSIMLMLLTPLLLIISIIITSLAGIDLDGYMIMGLLVACTVVATLVTITMVLAMHIAGIIVLAI
jgi:hypothetical protein